MTYLCHYPSPPLNAYVNALYYLEGRMPYAHEIIVPYPSLDLKINLGGDVFMVEPDAPNYMTSLSESWCVGMWNVGHRVQWPADMQIFGVNLKPMGAYLLFNQPLYELHNQVVRLDAIWGRFAAEIRERLYAVPTLQERFDLLERLLLTRLSDAPYTFRIVHYAATQIARHRGMLSIRTLSDEIGISQTHLATLFKQMIGTLPKELARLHRFERVLRDIDLDRSVNWTWIAHQHGYYDQSHFSKDFEMFTGHSPTEYLRLRRQVCTEHPDHVRLYRNLPII